MGATDFPAEEYVRDVLRLAVHPQRLPLNVSAHHLGGEPVKVEDALGRPFEPFAVGEKWGPAWDTTWFRFRAVIPSGWAGEEVVALIHLGGERTVGFSAEGLVWEASGRAVQGLHHKHRSYRVAQRAEGGEAIEFYVEAAANPVAPSSRVLDGPRLGPDYGGTPLYVLSQAELATVDRRAEALYLDACLVLELQDLRSDLAADAIAALHQAAAAAGEADTGGESMADHLRAAIAPILRRRSVSAAHRDGRRSRPHRLGLAVAGQGDQAQVRSDLFQPAAPDGALPRAPLRLQPGGPVRVDEGRLPRPVRADQGAGRETVDGSRWAACGSSPTPTFHPGSRWSASSCTASASSPEEFGVETHEMWIPDVFGYSAALPQIAREAGVTALITQKMSWNDTNVFPHSTFWWEGHDGSRILAHFPPANTYNGDFSVGELARSRATTSRTTDARTEACTPSGTATEAAARPPGCSSRAAGWLTWRACPGSRWAP